LWVTTPVTPARPPVASPQPEIATAKTSPSATRIARCQLAHLKMVLPKTLVIDRSLPARKNEGRRRAVIAQRGNPSISRRLRLCRVALCQQGELAGPQRILLECDLKQGACQVANAIAHCRAKGRASARRVLNSSGRLRQMRSLRADPQSCSGHDEQRCTARKVITARRKFGEQSREKSESPFD
jgi:hypothetical protein